MELETKNGENRVLVSQDQKVLPLILEKVSEGKFRWYSAEQRGCSQQERLTYL